MTKHRVVFAVLMIVWITLYAFNSAVASQLRPYKEGELLVQFKAGTRSSGRIAVQSSAGVRRSQAIGRSRIHHVLLEPGVSVDQALAVYAASPDVEFVEPNYMLRTQAFPADPLFDQQWGLYNSGQFIGGYAGTAGADLDAPQAWDIATGQNEVVVAVVDTGCDLNHPDLAANIWTNPGEIPDNGVDDDGNNLIDDVHGWDFSDLDNDPQDASGHGSHVAGIIGAVGNNELGIAGLAWRVRIMPLRFMNAFEEGSTADAIAAIEYALDKGAMIINCSWGSSSYSRFLRKVMANSNALFICAAGNNGRDTDYKPFYPAGFEDDNILSVAASDQMDRLAGFSNYGTASVDVAAPGVRILSLSHGRRSLWSEGFQAGLPGGWATGGDGDTWGAGGPPATTGASALAVNPSGNYSNDADTWALAPVQDLSNVSAGQLTFQIIGRSQSDVDYLSLQLSTDGSTWYPSPLQMGGVTGYKGISGNIPFWMTVKADLGTYDGQPQLFIRLHFNSNATDTATGFFIDNLLLTTADPRDSYQNMQGTSMAAASVSGLASLILSENNGLSAQELKSIIESSVDLNQNLLDKVASGGRVNAFNALTLLSDLSLDAVSATADRIQLSWTTQEQLGSLVYIERRSENQADFETVAQVDAGATTFADVDLIAGSTYYYRVQAETRDGRSGYSNQTLATTLETNPTGSGGGGGGGCFVDAMINQLP